MLHPFFLASLYKQITAVKTQEVPEGQQAKNILCENFKNGNCTLGDKCPFSHDLNINFNDYRTFSGKYLKYETIVKEYNKNDELIFVGEYLNGVRNGKGKEYYNDGQLKYDGEYLNGKRNGKGKEYNKYGELIFEGEYLNGKRND